MCSEISLNMYRKWPNRLPGRPFILSWFLGVKVRAFNRYKAFVLITVTSSKKLSCFRQLQKYQKSLKIAEYPLHQLICLGRLGISIALSNPNVDVRILNQCYCVAIVDLSLLWTAWHWARWNTQSFVNQTWNWMKWTILLLFANSY